MLCMRDTFVDDIFHGGYTHLFFEYMRDIILAYIYGIGQAFQIDIGSIVLVDIVFDSHAVPGCGVYILQLIVQKPEHKS